jgi:hypothetical protein
MMAVNIDVHAWGFVANYTLRPKNPICKIILKRKAIGKEIFAGRPKRLCFVIMKGFQHFYRFSPSHLIGCFFEMGYKMQAM